MIDLVGVIWLLVYNLQKRETFCVGFGFFCWECAWHSWSYTCQPKCQEKDIHGSHVTTVSGSSNILWFFLIIMEIENGCIWKVTSNVGTYHWTSHCRRKGNHDLTYEVFRQKKQRFSLEFGSHFRSTPSIRYDRGNPIQKIRSQIAKIIPIWGASRGYEQPFLRRKKRRVKMMRYPHTHTHWKHTNRERPIAKLDFIRKIVRSKCCLQKYIVYWCLSMFVGIFWIRVS